MAKITIGMAGIVASIALTVATGGSMLPAIISALKYVAGNIAISMAIGGIIGYLVGGKDGLKAGLKDCMIDGFMWGGLGSAIQHEILNEPIKVYKFEVEDFHSYFVTSCDILVHNMCAMNNYRTLKETTIEGYKVSMDLERDGSGLLNIHLKINNTKYFWDGKKFVSAAGRTMPNSLKGNKKIESALIKALEAIVKGRI